MSSFLGTGAAPNLMLIQTNTNKHFGIRYCVCLHDRLCLGSQPKAISISISFISILISNFLRPSATLPPVRFVAHPNCHMPQIAAKPETPKVMQLTPANPKTEAYQPLREHSPKAPRDLKRRRCIVDAPRNAAQGSGSL